MRLPLIFSLMVSALYAQTQFEVATIRPSEPVVREDGSPRTQFEGSNFLARGLPLMRLILQAYDLQEYQISGGPRWMNEDRYEVSAKVPDGGDPSAGANRVRLRALLAERFQLTVHEETKQATILALTVGKGGAKLAQHTEAMPGRTVWGVSQVSGKNADMVTLAGILSRQLRRHVIDRTGLSGTFDFEVRWDPNQETGTGPTVFTALQEQLGLKLESTKGPLEVLVVDSAERPAGN